MSAAACSTASVARDSRRASSTAPRSTQWRRRPGLGRSPAAAAFPERRHGGQHPGRRGPALARSAARRRRRRAVLRRGGRTGARVRTSVPSGEHARRGDPAQRHPASPAARAAPACGDAAPRRGGPLAVDTDPDRARAALVASVRQARAAFDQAAAEARPRTGCRAAGGRPAPGTGQPRRRRADAGPAHHAARPRAHGIDGRGAGGGLDAGRGPRLPLGRVRRDVRPAPRRGPDGGPSAARRSPAWRRSRRDGDAAATAACPASATSSTPTATRGPRSCWPLCGGVGAQRRLRRRVEALSDVVAAHSGLLPNIDLASAAVAARAGPAGRGRRGRLPGRPLPWASPRTSSRSTPRSRSGGAAGRPPAEPSTEHPRPMAGAESRPSGIRHDPESVRAPGRRRGGAPRRASRWRQRRRR